MTLPAALLVYAALVTAGGPLLLTRSCWQIWRPRTALLAWHAAAGTSLVAVLAAAVGLLQRLSTVGPRSGGPALGLFGAWAVLVALCVTGASLLARVDPVVGGDLASRDDLEDALDCPGCTRERLENLELRTVTSAESFALSCRAPGPTVVLSTTLRERLTEAETRSVIEHERAHLRQRHHLAVLAAVAQRAMLPWFRPARQLECATRLLVELIADDVAVRECGAEAVAGALRKMTVAGGAERQPSAQMRAERVSTR